MEIKGYFIGASLKAGRQGTGSHATKFYELFPLQKKKNFSLQILSILTDVFCHKRLVK